MTKTRKLRKKSKKHKKKIYTKKHYQSGDGMVTSVWGPPLWHYLHTMSFNYPVKPTPADKRHYKNFILSLRYVLPCRYCRENLSKNLKALPLTNKEMRSRSSFSRWVFKLHELINTMLGKKSGLKYCDVRERYEHFRSRCTNDKKFSTKKVEAAARKTRKKKEKGCTEPLYGAKSKCIVKIVPKSVRGKSFQMDKKCKKKRIV
jgi:hypothetical protein|tara:strand:- start:1068 stop:1676 length:609 start_codon:yes stop_codon:yes gene_type:complete